jgi:hypothetical protein
MGTRSLTFVYDGNSAIINMYRQFDGYPTGHGQELADFLDGFEIVNGYGKVKPKIANGMGCLAAQMIAHFKQSVGGFYIHPVTDTDCWQDYEYHVYENKVVVKNPSEVIFEGTWSKFNSFCHVDEKEEITETTLIVGKR